MNNHKDPLLHQLPSFGFERRPVPTEERVKVTDSLRTSAAIRHTTTSRAPRADTIERYMPLKPLFAEWCKQGLCYREILDELERLGIRSATGQPRWPLSQLCFVMKMLGLETRRMKALRENRFAASARKS